MKWNNARRGVSCAVSVVLLMLEFCAPLSVSAISYPANLYHREERHDKFLKGDTLYMFYSGTDEARGAVHINDTLAVYRITPTCEVTPIGIIRVVSFVGETYLKAEVVEGEVKPDDIARKGKVSFLIISAGVCNVK